MIYRYENHILYKMEYIVITSNNINQIDFDGYKNTSQGYSTRINNIKTILNTKNVAKSDKYSIILFLLMIHFNTHYDTFINTAMSTILKSGNSSMHIIVKKNMPFLTEKELNVSSVSLLLCFILMVS